MPSFRDLKGQPVDEVVDSRTLPGLPDPGQSMVEREAVRQAVEKITASKPPKDEAYPLVAPWAKAPIEPTGEPGTFTECMGQLNVALDELRQAHERVQTCYERVRQAAAKDQARLHKLSELLKVLE
jgi:hypothetical protein